MQFEATGKIVTVMIPEEFVSKRGNTWRKQGFVIQTTEQTPKKMHFELWNAHIDEYGELLKTVDQPENERPEVLVKFESESTEFHGNWYTHQHAYYIRTNTEEAAAGRNIEEIQADLTQQFNVRK